MRHRKPVVWAVGSGLRGSGYPNALETIRLLENVRDFEVLDLVHWLPEDFRLWKLAAGNVRNKLAGLARLLVGSIISLARMLPRYRKGDWVYVPYPSVIPLWLLSLLPESVRPRCISDSYVTLWESFHDDRGHGTKQRLLSSLIEKVETRSLRAAAVVIADTTANADRLSARVGLPRSQVLAFPLALDQRTLVPPRHAVTESAATKVLFIGTFVPLQGTRLISEAIYRLRDRRDVDFILIGDGQDADSAAVWLGDNPRVHWLRDWQEPEILAEALARADICLGVFGGEGKAARVLPFKIYMALAAGKAIITQQNFSVPDGVPPFPARFVPAEVAALATAIEHLCNDKPERARLARDALTYYQDYLSVDALTRRWQKVLSSRWSS